MGSLGFQVWELLLGNSALHAATGCVEVLEVVCCCSRISALPHAATYWDLSSSRLESSCSDYNPPGFEALWFEDLGLIRHLRHTWIRLREGCRSERHLIKSAPKFNRILEHSETWRALAVVFGFGVRCRVCFLDVGLFFQVLRGFGARELN